MAARKTTNTRKKTGTRSAAPKKTPKKAVRPKKTVRAQKGKKQQKQQADDSGMGAEILLWFVLGVSILLAVSNFGIGGVVGEAVSNLFFGVFGLVSYIFPVFLFLATAFFISNNKNTVAYKKMAGILLLFLSVCMLTQLLSDGYFHGTGLMEYYQNSSRYRIGGGILGGLLCNVCGKAFGYFGVLTIGIISVIISFILITRKSVMGILKKGSTKVYDSAKARHELRSMEKEETPKQINNKKTGTHKTVKLKDMVPAQASHPEKKDAGDAGLRSAKKTHAPKQEEEVLPFTPENAFPIHRAADEVQDTEQNETTETAETEEAVVPVSEKKPARKKNSSPEEISSGIENVKEEIQAKAEAEEKKYVIPPLSLLKKGDGSRGDSDAHLRSTAKKLQETLHNFGVNVTINNVSCGPTVTRYELQPEQGVKVSRIVNLSDDIKLNLAATDIRIEAPIPGKAAVGIEVPNDKVSAVHFRDLVQSDAFINCRSRLAFAAGKDIAGKPVIADIAKMPHLLIAGATGSGKSVCINTLIMSILYKASPDEVRLIMIDPKVVELSVYNGIPHLLIPVVTDPKKAAGALNWAVAEMTERYNKFAECNVKDLKGYNAKIEKLSGTEEEGKKKHVKMPQIVIIVDELADLMMAAPGEVEDAICRLAQLARAAGIHLVIATQRPSVNVITGLIKANMPSRIAFSVSSGVDSRTILDMNGAEKLLGKGDMLFYPQGYAKPARVQGAFVSEQEVSNVVEFLTRENGDHTYDEEVRKKIEEAKGIGETGNGAGNYHEKDAYFLDAGKFIIDKDKASIGMLQRVFKIGFNRAARIMDQLSEAGVVGPEEGTKPRKVLMSMEEFEQYIEESM